jgi:uncharacterized protein YabN with tetrapyrrole methylase and pyrophosphatase domain
VTRPNLVVVGTGMQASAQVSPLAQAHIAKADKVLFLATDVSASAWIVAHTAAGESLERFYASGKARADTYEEIVEHVMFHVRSGIHVCFAVYGHPGVFAYATHESIRRAREEGYAATMLPAISAEDCLFADLGVDPAEHGCQSYEATDFLVHDRVVDPASALVLWQIAIVGNMFHVEECDDSGLAVLIDVLVERYGPRHEVTVYLASPHPMVMPTIRRLAVEELRTVDVPKMATLYVPPLRRPRVNFEMLRRLGLEEAVIAHSGGEPGPM